MTMTEGRLSRLERVARAASVEIACQQNLPLPLSVIDFILDDEYLAWPSIYPRQATFAKVAFCEEENLTEYDHAVIAEWASGYQLIEDHGVFRYDGSYGTQPDILQRLRRCRAEGRSHFGQILAVVGRRGAKGWLGAICCAYIVYQ